MPVKHTSGLAVSLVLLLFALIVFDCFEPGIPEVDAAEPVLLAPDPGIPDTVRVETVFLPTGSTTFDVRVSFWNDEQLMGIFIPIVWDSPDISCNSVIFTGSRVNYINMKDFEIDNTQRHVVAYAVVFFESLIPPGDGLFCTLQFSVDPDAPLQIATISSSFVPPAVYLEFGLPSGESFEPQFKPGEVRIYSTSVEETSWGAIKGLYR